MKRATFLSAVTKKALFPSKDKMTCQNADPGTELVTPELATLSCSSHPVPSKKARKYVMEATRAKKPQIV
jgi:hypothetical protein